jgi:hypothetical protein
VQPQVSDPNSPFLDAQRSQTPPPNNNVTININALDSRSINDRMGDLADAVRSAIDSDHPLRRDIIGLTAA